MKISILEYSAEWDRAFQSERHRLAVTLHTLDTCIEHIGSTAVPGLAAKPFIDIMIGLGRESGLDALIGPVTALGYEYIREYEAMAVFHSISMRWLGIRHSGGITCCSATCCVATRHCARPTKP